MGRVRIRGARADDVAAIYDICVRTADAGGDASALHDDLDLPGHVWAGAYVALEPEHGYVLVAEDDRPVGYVVGALDSRVFERRCEQEWWPGLRARYPLGSGETERDRVEIGFIHSPPVASDEVVVDYPSHLHIDLLPEAQGQGAGRRLIERLARSLAAGGSSGVHLGVAARNEKACAFYERVGFTEFARSDDTVTYVMPLSPTSR
ncbi:MAG: GNAT family N-acetyltransferase [Acidimicrobiaceae bacterium]|nr:GNAT family N-acetyltransferase [Acidimicrobiaceae bacterium]